MPRMRVTSGTYEIRLLKPRSVDWWETKGRPCRVAAERDACLDGRQQVGDPEAGSRSPYDGQILARGQDPTSILTGCRSETSHNTQIPAFRDVATRHGTSGRRPVATWGSLWCILDVPAY